MFGFASSSTDWPPAPAEAVAAGSNFTVAFLYNGTAWSGGSWGHGQTELPEEIRPEAGTFGLVRSEAK